MTARHVTTFVVPLVVLLLGTGCPMEKPRTNTSTNGCVPGRQMTCSCDSGAQGVQTCRNDGRYGACDCAHSSGTADTSRDTWSGPDATVDTSPAVDTTPAADTGDTANACGDGVCEGSEDCQSCAADCGKCRQDRCADFDKPDAVSTYDELRDKSGSPGDEAYVDAPRICGRFVYKSSDPYGAGDDGGIVIASGDGYWIRQFAHTPDEPIELDWYQLADGDEITGLWKRLASHYAPAFYVRMPTQKRTLVLDTIHFDAIGVTKLRLLESTAAVTIRHKWPNPTSRGQLLSIADYSDLVIGSPDKKESRDAYNLTFEGSFDFDDYLAGEKASDPFIEITQETTCDCEGHLRFNTIDPFSATGLRHWGRGQTKTLYVSGVHENSGLSFISGGGADHIVCENAKVTDPYATSMAWLGNEDGDNDWGKLGLSQKNRGRLGTYGDGATSINHVSGSVELQYGWPVFTNFFGNKLGDGPNDPFVVTFRDAGYTRSGVAVDTSGALYNMVKFDGTGSEKPDRRFLKIVQKGKDNLRYGVFLEAAICDDSSNCSGITTSHITFTLVNLANSVSATAASIDADRIHHITYRGDGQHPAMKPTHGNMLDISDHNVVRDGTFHSINVTTLANGQGGVDNQIKDVKLTGKVKIESGIQNTRLESVEFIDGAREVMTIGSGSDVTATDLRAPAGSEITGSGSLTCDGATISLPFTFPSSGKCQ